MPAEAIADMGMPSAVPTAPMPSAPPAPPPTPAANKPAAEPSEPVDPKFGTNAPDPWNEAFGDLEKFTTGDKPAKPDKKPDPKAKKETPKPEEKKAEEPAKPEEAKTDDKPAVPEKAPVQARELRTAYENSKARIKQLEAEVGTLKAERGKPAENGEFKALQERYEAANKRLQELDQEVKFAAYERSEEYKDRYEQPYIDAYVLGRKKTSSLKVTNEDGTVRAGTEEDFDRIMGIPNDGDAIEAADALFGKAGTLVINHRENVQRLNALRAKSIEDYRKNGSERIKQAEQQAADRQQHMQKLWAEESKAVKEKFDWARPKEGDDEGNKLLEKGEQITNMAFNSDQLNSLSPEQQVKINAAVYFRSVAAGRLLYWNRQLTAENAELQKELAAFKDSAPADGDGDERAEVADGGDDIDSIVKQLDKMARPY